MGATLLGDSRKVAYLTQAYDRGLPLPEERIALLFEIGGPGEEAGVAELDDAMQASVDSYVNPWSERDDPLTPGQFRTSLPLTVLPQVPVR